MARPNISLTRTLTCPNVVVTDTTTYPANPDPHKFANFNLYKLKVYDEKDQAEITYELPDIGTTYNILLDDGFYSLTFYFVPTGQLSLTYAINDCIIIAGLLYICTNAGILDNINPLLSVDSLWTLLNDETELYSDYIETFYVVSICGYAELYRDKLQTSLITNQEVCPKVNNDKDFVDCMKIIELFEYGDLINPSNSNLQSATNRNKVIEAFNKLDIICQ